MLHVYTGGRWDLPLLFHRTECCLLLLNSNIDAAFLRNRMRLSCFLRRWEGIHTNILMNVVWDSGGSHSFLTWSSVSIFPEKVPSGKKVHIHHRLILSHTQVPKEHSKYSNTQPRALQMRLRWASFFCLPFFCWPFWDFQKWIPNPVAVSVVAVIANCSVFSYWEEYLEYFRLLTAMWAMGAPNSESSTPSSRGVNSASKRAAAGLEGEIKDEGPCFTAVAHRRGGWCSAEGVGRSEESCGGCRAPT